MSQVIRDELARLKSLKAELDGEALALEGLERDLWREREALLNKVRAKRQTVFTVGEQIEKLEEFLRIEE